mgnify:CR=1 FL=1
MPSYSIESPGLDKLERALAQYPKIAEKRLQQGIEVSIAELQRNATKGVVPWRTGFLTHSFGLGIVIGKLFGKIAPTAKYAIFVHEGTRRTKPNKFMPRILDKAKRKIDSHFKRAADLMVKDIAKKAK